MIKTYTICNVCPFVNLIKIMAICLILDYYISVFQPDKDDLKMLCELHLRKSDYVQRIKEDVAVLTMQGKLRENSKYESLYIIVAKMAREALPKYKPSVGEDELFKRLNFILNGSNISNKCYKLSLNRLSLNLSTHQKHKSLFKSRYAMPAT